MKLLEDRLTVNNCAWDRKASVIVVVAVVVVVVAVVVDRRWKMSDRSNFECHKYLNVVEHDDCKERDSFVEQVDNMSKDNRMSRSTLL